MQELILKIGAKLDNNFAPVINETQSSLFQFKKEMTELNKVQNDVRGFQNIQKDMIETRNKFSSTKIELSRLKEEFKKNPSNKLKLELKKTAGQSSILENKLKSQISQYSQLKNSLTTSGVNVKKLKSEYQRLGEEFLNVEKKQNSYLKNEEKTKHYQMKLNKQAQEYEKKREVSPANTKNSLGSHKKINFGTDELIGYQQQLVKLNQLQNNILGFQNIQKDMIETRNKIITTKTELSRLKAELQKNPSDKLRLEVKKTSENIGVLENKLKGQIGTFSTLKQSLTSSGINVKKLRTEYGKLGEEFSKVEKKQNSYLKWQKRGNEWKKFDPVSMAKDFALVAPVATAVKLSLDDSTAFSDVKKQSGLSGKELEEFKYEILEATAHIPMLNKEIYALSAQALQSGVPIKEMSQFTSDAAIMATAFDIEAGAAAKTMATWRSAFGMTQPEVMKLADVVNYLGAKLSTTPGEITEVVNRIGSLGKLAGVTEKQTAALAAQIMAQGKGAEVTATGLKNMFLTLSAGNSVSDRQQSAYKKLGLTSRQVAEGMQQDAQGTLFNLLENVQALDEVEKASVLSDLFGKESIDIIAALNGDIGKLKGVFSDINNESNYLNSAMNEFNNKLENPVTQLELAKKAMLQTGINAGNVLLPHIVTIAQKTGDFFNWLSKVQRENPILLKSFMYLSTILVSANAAIGVGAFLLGNVLTTGFKIYDNWGKITDRITGAKNIIPMLNTGFTKVSALMAKMNMGMLMNPWVLGIAAVAGGAYLIIKNWDVVKEWFSKFITFVSEIFKWLWEHSPLKLMIDGVGKVFKFFTGGKQNMTQNNIQNIEGQKIEPIADLPSSTNSLIKSEEKADSSKMSNNPQITIIQKIYYNSDSDKMNPGLKREIEISSQQSYEKAMQEYERKNKRLSFT